MGFKRPGPANGESLDAPIKDGTLARVVASAPVQAGPAAQTPKRTSGRRSLVDQARAMAQNVAKNRKWISETYAASTLGARCQRWLDVNAKKTSQSDIERGLLDVLQDATDTERRHLSKHLSGDAFDVQPVTERSSARCASS